MLGGIIRGRRATLRVPTEADLPAIAGWMADPGIRRGGWLWGEPAMLATWKERLAEIAKDRRQVLWSVEADGRLAGLASVRIGWEGNDVCEIAGLVIDPAAQGRGVGGDASLALHRYLYDYLNLRASEASLPADNARALRLLERLGYARYARGTAVYYRDGAYTDQLRLRFERDIWRERWAASEREYEPHPPEAAL